MEFVTISILIILGIILLLLELLVVPGIGFAGVGGFVLIGIAVWYVYAAFGSMAGNLTLIGASLLLGFFVFWALRSKTWKRAALHAEIAGKSDGQPDTPIHVGDRGVTISRLNPSGKAQINDDFFEVRTFDRLIDNGKPIEVIKVEHRTIFVQEIK